MKLEIGKEKKTIGKIKEGTRGMSNLLSWSEILAIMTDPTEMHDYGQCVQVMQRGGHVSCRGGNFQLVFLYGHLTLKRTISITCWSILERMYAVSKVSDELLTLDSSRIESDLLIWKK